MTSKKSDTKHSKDEINYYYIDKDGEGYYLYDNNGKKLYIVDKSGNKISTLNEHKEENLNINKISTHLMKIL